MKFNYNKKLCLGMLGLLLLGCPENKKLTPYRQAEQSFEYNLNQRDHLSKINFLFFIDTSGSMDSFRRTLSNNAELFLKPILEKYPYYDYNFAFTSMSPESHFKMKIDEPFYFNEKFLNECRLTLDLEKESNLGSYIGYDKGFDTQDSIENMLCYLGRSIQGIDLSSGSEESYFQTFNYIVEHTDSQIISDFFTPSAFLVLFFISDNWSGIDYNRMLTEKKQDKAHIVLAKEKISQLKSLIPDLSNVRSYGAVVDYEKRAKCGSEHAGERLNNYPFHFYEFVKETKGLIVNICDSDWGRQLEEVYKDFFLAFTTNSFALEKTPQLESIEVFLNGIEVPNDYQTGWSLHLEDLSISLGPELDLSYYQKDKKKQEADKLLIRYQPLNLELLQ